MVLGFCIGGPFISNLLKRLPDDVPGHSYAVAIKTVHLALNAQVSLYPWKDTPDKIPLAVRHIRTFLRAHRPVVAARAMARPRAWRRAMTAMGVEEPFLALS
jgi:hypothetical protein